MPASLPFRFSNYALTHMQSKTNCRVILVSRLFLGCSPSQRKGKVRQGSGGASPETSPETTAAFKQRRVFECVSSGTGAICLLKRNSIKPEYQARRAYFQTKLNKLQKIKLPLAKHCAIHMKRSYINMKYIGFQRPLTEGLII